MATAYRIDTVQPFASRWDAAGYSAADLNATAARMESDGCRFFPCMPGRRGERAWTWERTDAGPLVGPVEVLRGDDAQAFGRVLADLEDVALLDASRGLA